MNRLNKIILSFVLPFFCLLVSVSHAEFTGTPMNNGYGGDVYSSSPPFTYAGYSCDSIKGVCINFMSDKTNSVYKEAFDTLVSTLGNSGYGLSLFTGTTNGGVNENYVTVYPLSVDDIGLCIEAGNTYFSIDLTNGDYTKDQFVLINLSYSGYSYFAENLSLIGKNFLNLFIEGRTLVSITGEYSSKSIKEMDFNSTGWWWTGAYYYEASSEEPENPDTPSLPSNAEIASAVQAFYNSDYYKNNKNFSDFLVMYTPSKGNYTFIGHTLGSTLGQVIIPPNYRYQGKLYDQQWWKFYVTEDAGATPYGTSYYLYNINNTSMDIVTDEGVGKISELVNIDFSSSSVIIYSTTDYPVRTYVLDENTGDYTYTDGIIEGDQYTYDENLDPTQSGYNPLDNFVTVNPSDTIVNNADFGDLSNSFEEHKDIFSFTENMQWLILANNKLSNYFLGFIVMCALFITLGRVLKG